MLRARWLGRVPYGEADRLQRALHERAVDDYLLLLEHPHVYTLGTTADPAHVLVAPATVGAELVHVDRGGDVTYHGPGQLVGYPIMRIEHVDRYLRTMEDAISAALATHGISARGRPLDGPDYTGVWVGERKIASIGVHVSRGVTTHGFAVNVENDLEPFSWVVACGLPGVQMTSVESELGAARAPSLACFRREMAYRFCQAHGRRARLTTPSRLGIAAVPAPARAPVAQAVAA